MPDPALPLNDLPPSGVGFVVVLLLVGSAVAVLVRFLPMTQLGRGPGYRVLALLYGVVLTSILLQGVTIGPVARRLLGHGQTAGVTS